jgi:hypothetical protein
METLDNRIVRAALDAFPHINEKYDSLLELSRDYETIRECHVFFLKLAGTNGDLINRVNTTMFTWRGDMIRQMAEIMGARQQKMLVEFGIFDSDVPRIDDLRL